MVRLQSPAYSLPAAMKQHVHVFRLAQDLFEVVGR
jgi:hypothetical protein